MAPATRKSRYATQLDAAIAAASNPVERCCREAERAALWARQGHGPLAQQTIDTLRSQAALQPVPLALVWLDWAEAVTTYYKGLNQQAAQQLRIAHERAQALLRTQPAARLLSALTAAWLALHSFTRRNPPQLAALLRQAYEFSDAQQHLVRGRAALAAAYAYYAADRADLALPWHELSRQHGVSMGDDVHISALMYNQAFLRCGRVRRVQLLGDPQQPMTDVDIAQDIAQTLMMVESGGRFDDGIGIVALRSLVPTLRAQLFTAQGRWEDALALFNLHLESALQQGLAMQASCLHADVAWCEWQLGQAERSAHAEQRALAALELDHEPDDRAMTLARLAQLAQTQNQTPARAEQAQRWRGQAELAFQAHRTHQQALTSALDAALTGLAPLAAPPRASQRPK